MANAPDPRKVFVVHGRDESARLAMFEFLRAIGLDPMEWSQIVDLTKTASPFVGEVLEVGFKHAQAVVVLLTGDDKARLRKKLRKKRDPDYEGELTPQPRPNVLFEAGMAFGINPKRTLLVEIGNLRPFSDVSGRLAVRMANSVRARQEVAQRLKAAGCKVNLRGTDWQKAGKF
ncbi:MAG: TIR domain-containing protein [Candidatus Methylomirabilales bacterium]